MRRYAIIASILALIPLAAAVGITQDPLTVLRLDQSNSWETLPQVNAYATAAADASSPVSGSTTSGATALPIRARAVLDPDLRSGELTVDFTAVSSNIRTADHDLFIAPLGHRLEWVVVYTVRNPNDVPMTGVKVWDEIGWAVRATVSGKPSGTAWIEDVSPRGGLPFRPTFMWNIGDLAPGAAVRAEVTLVTTRDGNGRLQFSEPGIYYLDAGAQLTYTLMGQPRFRNAPCATVLARHNPDAIRSDGGAYELLSRPIAANHLASEPPVVKDSPVPSGTKVSGIAGNPVIVRSDADIGSRDISRTDPRFSVTAVGKTSSISEDPVTSEFVVNPGQYAEWEVTVTLTNPGPSGNWESFQTHLVFGAQLSVEEISGSRSVGGRPLALSGSVSIVRGTDDQRVRVTWSWTPTAAANDLSPGESAALRLKVYTTSPTGYTALGTHEFLRRGQLNYKLRVVSGAPYVAELSAIRLRVEDTASANIALSASRVDWRVAKPGTYATVAATISVTGTGRLSVDFSGFGDLLSLDGGPGVIGAYYNFGQNTTTVPETGWIGATALNSFSLSSLELDPSTPATLVMWARITVGGEDPSCEYENTGVITFTASNN